MKKYVVSTYIEFVTEAKNKKELQENILRFPLGTLVRKNEIIIIEVKKNE